MNGSAVEYKAGFHFRHTEELTLTGFRSSNLCTAGEADKDFMNGKICLARPRPGCFLDAMVHRAELAGCVAVVAIAEDPFPAAFFIHTSWLQKANIFVFNVGDDWKGWNTLIELAEGGMDVKLRFSSSSSVDTHCSSLCDNHILKYDQLYSCTGVQVSVQGFLAGLNVFAAALAVAAIRIRLLVKRINKTKKFDLFMSSLVVCCVGSLVRAVLCVAGPFFIGHYIPYEIQISMVDMPIAFSLYSTTAIAVIIQRLTKESPPLTSPQIFMLLTAGCVSLMCLTLSALRPLYQMDLFRSVGRLPFLSTGLALLANLGMFVHLLWCGSLFLLRYRHMSLWGVRDLFSEHHQARQKIEHKQTLRFVGALVFASALLRCGVVVAGGVLAGSTRYSPELWLGCMATMYLADTLCAIVIASILLYFSVIVHGNYRVVLRRYENQHRSSMQSLAPEPAPSMTSRGAEPSSMGVTPTRSRSNSSNNNTPIVTVTHTTSVGRWLSRGRQVAHGWRRTLYRNYDDEQARASLTPNTSSSSLDRLNVPNTLRGLGPPLLPDHHTSRHQLSHHQPSEPVDLVTSPNTLPNTNTTSIPIHRGSRSSPRDLVVPGASSSGTNRSHKSPHSPLLRLLMSHHPDDDTLGDEGEASSHVSASSGKRRSQGDHRRDN